MARHETASRDDDEARYGEPQGRRGMAAAGRGTAAATTAGRRDGEDARENEDGEAGELSKYG